MREQFKNRQLIRVIDDPSTLKLKLLITEYVIRYANPLKIRRLKISTDLVFLWNIENECVSSITQNLYSCKDSRLKLNMR